MLKKFDWKWIKKNYPIPTEYIVRLWVDVKVPASTRMEAMEKAHKLGKTTIEGAEIYDEQVADAWPYGEDK